MKNIVITLLLTVSCSILETGHGQRNKCGIEKFQCKSGECIESVLLCDGLPHCKDDSDETLAECSKPDITCPDYAFRCAYGACVDGDSACNGKKDCIDNSDETLPRCNGSNNISSVCQNHQFMCNNGQCISKTNLCDGTVDCTDTSDETFIQCGSISCERFLFKCRYGACIDGDLKCNGATNCLDGSDEDPTLCRLIVTSTERPVTLPPVTPVTPKPKPYCTAPAQPQNGSWKLNSIQCFNEADCNVRPGDRIDPGTSLVFTCTRGYKIEGKTDVYCSNRGEWSYIPRCVEVHCEDLNSIPIMATYSYPFDAVSNDAIKPGTMANLKCRDSYTLDRTIPTSNNVMCNATGMWHPNPIKCIAVCGSSTSNIVPLIVNGTTPKITEFPWHATLYKADIPSAPKQFICGATIIHASLLITAAHCVYNDDTSTTDDPSKYFVAAGNIYNDYDYAHSKYVMKTQIQKIYVPCKYNGRSALYTADVAILKVVDPFVFSSLLQPICLDFSNNIVLDSPDIYGKVAGFGRTATGPNSFILQSLVVPYVPNKKCQEASLKYNTQQYITLDKFCGGYTNGSSVCEGDSGGGLIFQMGGFWYVKGIVSVSLGATKRKGVLECDTTSYTLYTNLYFHMPWIQWFLNNVQQNELLPICDGR